MSRRNPQATVLPKPTPRPEPPPTDGDTEFAARLGERARRLALGLFAMLIVARAYWPGEPDLKFEAGGGLVWDLAVLVVAGLAVASALIGGTLRVRWSWTDAAVIALMFLVGLSSTQAHDRRPAINLAWDWAAVGFCYVLLRNLPRTRNESAALAGALVATAVAVSVYGLYQVSVELDAMRAQYHAHPAETLQMLGITPGTPGQKLFENRLLQSTEPMSTFALGNSLAGFIVGPLVVLLAVGWENLVRREGRGSPFSSLALAAVPALVMLVCLILTKSRSAWVGLAVAVAILAFRERRRVRTRTLVLAGLGGIVVVGGLVAAGLATRRLDRQVLTESTKSLRYRLEYWVGTWRVITAKDNSVFWKGHGPGNFTAHYLKHKLPESSEEIFDPHDMVLEVWATAGVSAMVALLAALTLAFVEIFGSAKIVSKAESDTNSPLPRPDPTDPPRRTSWLLVSAGLGWLAVVFLGELNPFQGDLFFRWLILGGAWLWAILFGMPLWRRAPIAAIGLGAGAVALSINLLAAGGIGISPVALMLWALIALGLNFRDDRGCGRLREVVSRLPAFGLALVWAALLGSFFGAVLPFWKSEAAIAEAEEALRARPPQFERAEAAYIRAYQADKYSARPWLGLALEKFEEWRARGAKIDDRRWSTIPLALGEAVTPPRNPYSWSLHINRAMVTRDLIAQIGSQLKPLDLIRLRGNVVEATRRATLLYPSNATLHAQLAEANAQIDLYPIAVEEAKEALRLDKLTPHLDKKLPPRLRKRLEEEIPRWEKKAPVDLPKGLSSKP